MSGPALVACDSFKGTFAAAEATAAIARGLRGGGRDAGELPIADGGEGTMEVLVSALGGEVRRATVSDPLGRPVQASLALLSDGASAVVECAQASGLGLVEEGERDALAASTRGTGELIAAAVAAGAEAVLVTVGARPPQMAAQAPSRHSTRPGCVPRYASCATSARRGSRPPGRSGPRRARTKPASANWNGGSRSSRERHRRTRAERR